MFAKLTRQGYHKRIRKDRSNDLIGPVGWGMSRMIKACALLLLVSLTLMSVMPFSVNLTRSEGIVLVTLDVCGSADEPISLDDSPAVQEPAYSLIPAGPAGLVEKEICPYKPFVTIYKEEHPPQSLS